MLRANFGLESLVIPNGHPAPSRQGIRADPPVVLWVANIKAWKQPEIFMDLAKRLNATDAKSVMAGKEDAIKQMQHWYYQRVLVEGQIFKSKK